MLSHGVLGAVAALVDSRRNATGIAALLPDDEPTVRDALGRLAAWGLIDPAPGGAAGAPPCWRDARDSGSLAPLLALLDGPVEALIEPRPPGGAPVRVFAAFAPWAASAEPPAGGSRREVFSGRGTSAAQAVTSCLGEAAERLSARFRSEDVAVRESLDALGSKAVDPRDVLLYGERQYAGRGAWNARHAGRDRVPPRFDPVRPVDWVCGRSLTGGAEVLLPAACCLLDYPWGGDEPRYCASDSNGLASGPSVDAAIRSALCEVIERDAVAIWWYGRLRRPRLDAVSLGDPEVDAILAWNESQGRRAHLLDLTTDLDVPVVAAVSAETGGRRVLFGFGADPDARRAARSALTEMAQIGMSAELVEAHRAAHGEADLDPSARAMCDWLARVSLDDAPWLSPAEGASVRAAAAGDDATPARLVDACAACGLDPLLVDLTRADLGVPAVRAVVPGLRHIRPRFAPGRLYRVPVAMGWIARPIDEAALNPIPVFV